MTTHGDYGSALYKKWMGIKRRCLNKNDKSYISYGAKGITVCDKWLRYEGFREDMESTFIKGLSIDRIDNAKGYSKENCRWVPLADQAKNKTNVPLYEHGGLKLNASDWDRNLGLKQGTVGARIKMYGWDIERAITSKKTTHKGVFFDKERNNWRVEAARNGNRYFVGRFNTEKEALLAREKFLKELKND